MRTLFNFRTLVLAVGILTLQATLAAIVAEAQTQPRSRTVRPTPTPTPSLEPAVISRADEYLDENGAVRRIVTDQPAEADQTESRKTIEALQERIKQLEASKTADPDAKQRRMLLNLDILTRAEQRVDSLRKQVFEMIEKENSIQARMETLEMESRPEIVDRGVAFAGTLRPEELREARTRQLAAERTKLQNLLTEVQKNKANLEANVLKAEDLVERLRTKLERDIDEALKEDEPEVKP